MEIPSKRYAYRFQPIQQNWYLPYSQAWFQNKLIMYTLAHAFFALAVDMLEIKPIGVLILAIQYDFSHSFFNPTPIKCFVGWTCIQVPDHWCMSRPRLWNPQATQYLPSRHSRITTWESILEWCGRFWVRAVRGSRVSWRHLGQIPSFIQRAEAENWCRMSSSSIFRNIFCELELLEDTKDTGQKTRKS